ncbi:uncharacterized protein SPAPADRAFT_58850 [Spathaspora passalidarum NRRL Y-27907]|uniref:Suppressor of lethality of KEX2 GAS1 double null mutant protein 1 n=1 Tax=Spathaspora passalidarum (strain NRRL Y-27907 / 11-Y1) TaxID=619300 RepID=G3AEA8_SPAPN|nr:uncharacterized protein SPAPADRAFT_58850 [Spathaspora passalidarum NRRL Y-27907]EGW35642.1 hypothetical protein SPAPADRAFT_58850 [Spathaspora passalidarum NRRL Y-27907]
MANSQSLAVGLAVGIPSFLIIVVVVVFWYRNNKKQTKEDLEVDAIDLELREDQSFRQFHEELHQPYVKEKASSTLIYEKAVVESGSSASEVSPNQTKPTAYDFYETFIPMLPPNQPYTNNNTHKTHTPRASSTDLINVPTSPDVSVSETSSTIDILAKQLHQPEFFEKLPSKAAKIQLKPRNPMVQSNNSSTDMINNYLVSETRGINDHFTYEATAVDIANERREQGSE